MSQPTSQPSQRARQWLATMSGYAAADVVLAHSDSRAGCLSGSRRSRRQREDWERAYLRSGATLAEGAGDRAEAEAADPDRTCFERDRDRIIHSTAFRRLAGKTQVVVYPSDHQRTRLTHAIEVAQVAVAVARGLGLNTALTEAIALGHDCGHGPGGHASEDAFSPYLEGGFEHGPWGADVTLAGLNLCRQTLDGIRRHSWSQPAPETAEGEIVSWADRIAYCAHDLEDACRAGIVDPDDIPDDVVEVCGRDRREQIGRFVTGLMATVEVSGRIGLEAGLAGGLARLRAFNYDRIYTRAESVAQAETVIVVLRGLVEYYLARPKEVRRALGEQVEADPVRATITYVDGMTDRFAFAAAERLLGWDPQSLPAGLGRLA